MAESCGIIGLLSAGFLTTYSVACGAPIEERNVKNFVGM